MKALPRGSSGWSPMHGASGLGTLGTWRRQASAHYFPQVMGRSFTRAQDG